MPHFHLKVNLEEQRTRCSLSESYIVLMNFISSTIHNNTQERKVLVRRCKLTNMNVGGVQTGAMGLGCGCLIAMSFTLSTVSSVCYGIASDTSKGRHT